ncbi:A nuclease of the HNH/ENDO VII superfamily with conserved WHH [Anaeromicropila populeti]|uniref:A nuclease of the HNH/ENDO VII superfamily with conserved WHH n=2 Tax=Anaeromicropila populeti TaxID=37658 RepID=A0A1I6K0A3_9FIRM|nr:A nuclease of the HNH/ENDO VII superfamily with conserved WHH [Anaeromicropila populeti]
MPDFSQFTVGEVEIDNMTSSRSSNFYQADEKLAQQWTDEKKDGKDWTKDDIEQWRQDNKYIWHELNDTKTMQLVPSIINTPIFMHLGGVGECNIKRKG